MSGLPVSPSALSVQRAFVVQFRADTQIESGSVSGRVEHIASRMATTFDSLEDLLAFIYKVLQQTRNTADDDEPAGSK